MRNVEFKSELRDLEAARLQCGLIGARPAGTIAQVDTYFRVPSGRLKRREAVGCEPEWIVYARPDSPGARVSTYTLLTESQARIRYGEGTLRPWKVVRKLRELWLLDNVRIHLDQVEDLGRFIEFEAVVGPTHDLVACRALVIQLREQFDPILGEPVGASYEALVPESDPAASDRRYP